MKIVTWNCNGAFRQKYKYVCEFDADIYVIQECENPAESKDKEYNEWAKNYLWIGDNKSRGLAVFAKEETKLENLGWTNRFEGHNVKYFLPCKINGKYDLLAVWTHRNNSPNFGYIGQMWKYLQINRDNIRNSFIIGDFNSNSIWDQWDRWWNHSDVVKQLNDLGIESYYHKFTGEYQGKETIPTLFFRKNREREYHIDYIFGPKIFAKHINNIKIGAFEQWIKLSDHMPIFCDIDIDV